MDVAPYCELDYRNHYVNHRAFYPYALMLYHCIRSAYITIFYSKDVGHSWQYFILSKKGSTAMRYTDSSTLTLEFSTVLSTLAFISLLYKSLDTSIVAFLIKYLVGITNLRYFHVLWVIIFLIVT